MSRNSGRLQYDGTTTVVTVVLTCHKPAPAQLSMLEPIKMALNCAMSSGLHTGKIVPGIV